MRIAFRVDASLQIGTGHVMRCLTLADSLRACGGECIFVCRVHGGHLSDYIIRRGYQVIKLPLMRSSFDPKLNSGDHIDWLGTDWATDAVHTREGLLSRNRNQKLDWLVVDHYSLDYRWERTLGTITQHVMVIDDIVDRQHDCDVFLNQNLGYCKTDYLGIINADALTLIGPEYALLRPEFTELRSQSLARRVVPHLRSLLITMGGIDKDNTTGQVLNALKACNMPRNLNITVVMGVNSLWLERVKLQAKCMPRPTQVLVDVENMAQLMADSDLAIGAAGSTSWERCCLGLPTIQMAIAANQKPIADALNRSGSVIDINTKKVMQNLPSIFSDNINVETLRAMSICAQSITSGVGTKLVTQHLVKFHEDFIPV